MLNTVAYQTHEPQHYSTTMKARLPISNGPAVHAEYLHAEEGGDREWVKLPFVTPLTV